MVYDLSDPSYCYRLEIFGSGKEWITANQRLYWAQRARRTRQWREVTALKARERAIPKLDRCWVVAELRFSDKRRRDPANWAPTAKACVDGLVDAGVVEDDDHTRVVGPDMRIGPVVPPAWRGIHLLIYPLEKR